MVDTVDAGAMTTVQGGCAIRAARGGSLVDVCFLVLVAKELIPSFVTAT
jgi:hypothetical protein